MGFENRDYYRERSYTGQMSGFGVDFTPTVKYIIILNVVVFLLQIFVIRTEVIHIPPDGLNRPVAREDRPSRRGNADDVNGRVKEERISVVTDWLQRDPVKVVEGGQVWRLFTSAFCHDRSTPWHILLNMLLLYWFGTRLERMYGSREFLLFYLAATLCASLLSIGLAYYTNNFGASVGASGPVMAVMMLYTIFHPHEKILLFFIIPVPLWALLGIYVLFDIHPVLLQLAGDERVSNIGHAAHLGGLAFGYIYWKTGMRLSRLFERSGVRPFRPPPRRRDTPPPEPVILPFQPSDTLADQLDEVLKKISERGQDNLTESEKEILQKASTRYRK